MCSASYSTPSCTGTEETLHERLFKSALDTALPSWLLNPGKALSKKNVGQSKCNRLAEGVDVSEYNLSYAYVRFPSGRKDATSVRQLTPPGGYLILVPK